MTLAARVILVGLVATGLIIAKAVAKMSNHSSYNVGTVSMTDDRQIVFDLWIWDPNSPYKVQITVSPNSQSYPSMRPLVGNIAPGDRKSLPPWVGYDGLITMANDRSVVLYKRVVTTDVGDAFFASKFPPGNELGKMYMAHVGGLVPQEVKPVPLWPENIGSATMLADGTIRLHLRSQSASGIIAETVVDYRFGDPMYAEVLRHLGGIKVGEEKAIPPWPSGSEHLLK